MASSFGEFAVVFALADGGMVAGDLGDSAGLKQVEPGIADVADGDDFVLDKGDGEDAGHASTTRVGVGEAVDFVIGEGDGFAEALFGRAGLAFQALADDFDGGFGGVFAGGVATDAVDYGEDAAVGVDVERSSLLVRRRPMWVPDACFRPARTGISASPAGPQAGR